MALPEIEGDMLSRLRNRLESWGDQMFFVAFFVLAVVPPLFYLNQPLLHDEMAYLVIGRELALGGTLYAGVADHKTPAIFYLTALLWETTPEPYIAGRIVVYTVDAVTALLVFRLGSGWGRTVGAVASLAYLAGVYGPVFEGYILMTEPFAAMFLTGAALCLFAERRGTDLLAGLLLACGVLFNQTTLLFGAVIIGWSLARLWGRETTLAEVAVRYGLIGTAFVTLLGLPALIAATQGTLEDMVWYTFVLPLNYYNTPYFLEGQLSSAASYLPVWLLATGTALCVFRSLLSRSFDTRLALLSLWLFILAIPGLRAFHGGHRYIFIMPAAAVLAGVGLHRVVEFLRSEPTEVSRGWLAGLTLAATVSVAILLMRVDGTQYMLLMEVGLAGAFLGAMALSYETFRLTSRVGQLNTSQWIALVVGIFLVLTTVGGAVGINGVSAVLHADDGVQTQQATAENLDEVVDGRFYALAPPLSYELAYFGEARPARTFIAAPYGEPLAERVVTTLERDEVDYVLIKKGQVDDGRIDPDHGYYAGPRRTVVAYVEANYEPVGEREGYVIYERVP